MTAASELHRLMAQAKRARIRLLLAGWMHGASVNFSLRLLDQALNLASDAIRFNCPERQEKAVNALRAFVGSS